MVPENIHTHAEEHYWKFQKEGSPNEKLKKENMNQNRNFLRDGRIQTKSLTVEVYGYFLKHIYLEDYATQKLQANLRLFNKLL